MLGCAADSIVSTPKGLPGRGWACWGVQNLDGNSWPWGSFGGAWGKAGGFPGGWLPWGCWVCPDLCSLGHQQARDAILSREADRRSLCQRSQAPSREGCCRSAASPSWCTCCPGGEQVAWESMVLTATRTWVIGSRGRQRGKEACWLTPAGTGERPSLCSRPKLMGANPCTGLASSTLGLGIAESRRSRVQAQR